MRHIPLTHTRKCGLLAWTFIFVFFLGFKSAYGLGAMGTFATQTVTLTQYNSDGMNTGTARLGRNTTFVPAVKNATNTAVTWTLKGAGSLSTSGVYTAPNVMPSSTTVTVTATLVENTAVSASYSFTLINPVPELQKFYPATLNTAATNTVNLVGYGLVPGTVVYVNGTAVTSNYQSLTSILVPIALSGTASGSVTVYAENAAPGGGKSASITIPIATPTMTLTEYSGDGTNTGTVRLGNHSRLIPTVTGSGNTAVTWAVTSGAGSMSADGYYQAPILMPANPTVKVTGTLVSNPAITASYTMNVINAVPSISSISPDSLSVGGTSTVNITGSGFVPGTVVYVNGMAVPATFASFSQMQAQIPVSGTATGPINITAVNASPGGGTSNAIAEAVTKPTLTLTASNSDGTNITAARVGGTVRLTPTVTGSLNTDVTWSVASGAGTITADGTYQAPITMPANTAVTVKAALVANPSITASYSFTLAGALPVINTISPNPLSIGGTNSVSINGANFVPGTIIYVNGSPVTTTYASSAWLSAQIPVSNSATGTVSVTAVNPSPNGGTSSAFSLPIATPKITLTEYSGDGTNTATVRLGNHARIVQTVTGSLNTDVSWSVIAGVGTIDANGYYQAPNTMPANTAVTIKAILTANSSISATYSLNLVNEVPSISSISPSSLAVGGTNSVNIAGSGFVPGTVIYVNGTAVSATYSSFSQMQAQIPVSGAATSPLSITAVNTAPGGGTSNAFSAAVAKPTLTLTATSSDGTNPAIAHIGGTVRFVPTVTGSLNSDVSWSVSSGAGTISTDGTYQAPSTMPSSTAVMIKAALVSNPSITASYSLTLVNGLPAITTITPNPVSIGGTNTVSINGANFIQGTVIHVNGSPVTTTFASSAWVSAQIPVSNSATGSLSITAVNPSPNGGTSSVFSLPVATPKITLTEFSGDGTNTATARLGSHVRIVQTVTGSLNTAVSWSVIAGVGTIDADGYYQAPNSMPTNTAVTIKATLAANSSISATYSLNIVNAAPTLNSASPNPLSIGGTNTVNINGTGFAPGTVIYVNGSPVATTYSSFTWISAQIPVSATATGTVNITAVNPAPGGGTSNAIAQPIATPKMTLTEYSGDGTNTATARIGGRAHLIPTITGSVTTDVTWTIVSGAGSMTTDGYYVAPTTMPSDTVVTIRAALVAKPAITASYTLNLINAVPVLSSVYPNPLQVAGTNSVSIFGSGFVPGTVIYADGKALATTYVSFSSVTAQLPIAGNATGSVNITAVTPAPGGGTSNAIAQPVAIPKITLNAYNGDGTNTGTVRLGIRTKIIPTVTGSVDTSVTWAVTSGVGSITSDGYYMPPSDMPSNPAVTVTGTLVANSAITASYSFKLINPIPDIAKVYPMQLTTNASNTLEIFGTGYVPGTQVYVNGTAVPTAYISYTQINAQVTVPDNATGAYVITAVAPAPGGGSSTSYSVPILVKTTQLNAYSTDGANPTTVRLGRNVQFYLAITNGTGDTTATWTVNGGGTITSSGLYQAPTAMPASTTVTVSAALVSNPKVIATYQLSLLNATPVISASNPANLIPGSANTVTIQGSGFVAGTTILVNGTATTTTFKSADAVQVQITPSSSANSVTVIAQNPSPGATNSSSFVIPVGTGTTLSATVGSTSGVKIPLNFVGFSHEWGEAQYAMGTNANGANLIYRQLLKNLMNGASYPFEIRIGGGSTDTTTVPTADTTTAFADLAKAIGAHFVLGVNLGADNVQLAVTQAKAYGAQMPSGSLDAIEIGNEGDDYAYSGMRSSSYSISDFFRDYATWRTNIIPVLPSGLKLMGPTWAELQTLVNMPNFLTAESSNISIVSHHFYAGHQWQTQNFASDFLLTPSASTQAATSVAPYVSAAHQKGELFRIGEMNSIDGGGITGISDTFGSALWAVDSMYELANVGVDGVNWHGANNCIYCAFLFSKATVGQNTMYTLKQVNPLYYGLLFFQWATGNNSKMLPVTVASSNVNVKVWATVDQNNTIHVAVLNKDKSFAGKVAINLSGHGDAQAIRLLAPSYQSNTGISIAGQTFDGSLDGTLVGSQESETISATNGIYSVPVQPTSAVLLTIK